MMNAIHVAVLLGALAFPLSSAVNAEKRVALIIGNSNYQHTAPLNNPGNDAEDVARALRGLGFQVIDGRDLTKAATDVLLRQFADALPEADVGLFFYAGHSLQVHGHNYIVPVDAKVTSIASLDFELIRLDFVQRVMERETPTNVLFLDACRNNPLARNLINAMGTRGDVRSGLAPVEGGVGTLISFSTQPGNVALDGSGRNSPFTEALKKHIGAPGIDLSNVLIRVRNDVIASTRGNQVPWEHSALRSQLFFAVPEVVKPDDAAAPGAAREETDAAREETGVAALKPPEPEEVPWQVKVTAVSSCMIRSAEFPIVIEGTEVRANRGTTGKVAPDGSIRFKRQSRVNPKMMMDFRGKLDGKTGAGKYQVLGGKCHGTFVMTRMD